MRCWGLECSQRRCRDTLSRIAPFRQYPRWVPRHAKRRHEVYTPDWSRQGEPVLPLSIAKGRSAARRGAPQDVVYSDIGTVSCHDMGLWCPV
jgi:hypothetical protein